MVGVRVRKSTMALNILYRVHSQKLLKTTIDFFHVEI